jgi:GTP-binding protein
MSFVDRVVVEAWGGRGGDGACSFARFKFKAKGGPDGGDGGHGGSIFLRGDANLSTLLDYRYRAAWRADRGVHGKGANKTGATAEDMIMPVPPGTEAFDADTGALIGEVMAAGDTVLVARGGRGGRGNAGRATPTHRAPREWDEGGEGEHRRIELVLKLIADVGLVGEPNAGKSTLLSVISAARPKIADYPFTTLEPNLGVVALSGSRTIVVADIPGIIEGAHEGKGLGLTFLQHVERTRVLAYLVPLDSDDPSAVLAGLRHEVAEHSALLAQKPFVVVLSKRDLLAADDPLPEVEAPGAEAILAISSAARSGLGELKDALWAIVESARTAEASMDSGEPTAGEHATDASWDLDWGETDPGHD